MDTQEPSSFEPSNISPEPQHSPSLLISLIIVALVVIAGAVYFVFSEDKSQETVEKHDQQTFADEERESQFDQARDFGIEVAKYQELSPLEKVRHNINFHKQYDPHPNVTETSYEGNYSYHYTYTDAGTKALAVVREPNGESDYSWNLYVLDDKGQEKLLYSGMIEDCCGGGMPTVSRDYTFPLPVARASTGDICFSQSEKIFVSLRDNSDVFTRIVEGNNCESFDFLTLERGEAVFKIEPVVSGDCKALPVGTSVTFNGLRATSDEKEFIHTFENPIKMECVDPEFGNYNMGISYEDVGGTTSHVMFDLVGYDEGKRIFTKLFTFSFADGLYERDF